VTGTCECGNELSGYIKCGEFLDWMRIGVLRMDCCLERVGEVVFIVIIVIVI